MRPALRTALLTTSTVVAVLFATVGTANADPSASATPSASSPSTTPSGSGSASPATSTSPATSLSPTTPPPASGSVSATPSTPTSPSASTSPTPPAGTVGSIAGTLTSAAGTPLVTTAYVEGGPSYVFRSTPTDAAGHYTFTGLAPGSYLVSFQIPGVGSRQFAFGRTGYSTADQITVSAGGVTTVDDTALPTGTVTGHLLDQAGSPVVGAWVRLSDPDTTASGYSTTDATGAFTARVFAGSYTVEFTHDGLTQYVPGKTRSSDAARYQVTAGATVTIEESLLPTGSVVGRLTTDDGAPVAGAQVNLTGVDNGPWTSTTTAADGSYRFAKVFGGQYRIQFVSADYKRHQFAHDAVDSADATTFTVTGGQTLTVDETLLPTGTIAITATDALTGAPIADFCAYLWMGGTDQYRCSDGSGQVTLTDVNIGNRHEVDLSGIDYQYLRKETYGVQVTAGQTTALTVTLVPTARIATTVVDAATGAPIAGVCVHAFTLTSATIGDGCGTFSDEQGKVLIGYQGAGTYTLLAVADDGVHGSQWVGTNGGTGSQYLAAKIQAVAGQTVTAPTIRLDLAGSISGRVTDATTGAPVRGVCVATTAVNGAWGRIGYCPGDATDEQGQYTIRNVGPYAWPVEFADNDMGGHAWQWSGGVTSRKRATTVAVTAGGTASLDARLTAGTTVTARIVGPAGAPAPSASVFLINPETGDEAGAFGIAENAYTMHVLPQTIVIGYGVDGSPSQYWYRGAVDRADATPVRVCGKALTIDLVVPAG